jgi:hypothetical protein
MNPAPDYSAAYVVITTDADDGHEGHGFVFTTGRGNDIQTVAIRALSSWVVGRDVEASPSPSERTPNYYPGGRVAGRPVPAGWYSEPWWKPALVAGAWGVGSALLFSSMFSGMGGVGYDAQGFEN